MSDYIKTLEYYFEDKTHITFEKYTIDTLGIIKHKISGKTPSYGKGKYNKCGVVDDDGNRRGIRVARAVASTFLGKPPTPAHTADHIMSEQKKIDALSNIRWMCKPGQSSNRIMPDANKSAFIVIKDGIEKTVNEWVVHLNNMRTPEDCKFTYGKIQGYARRKTRGFAYKEYPDLEGEKWREIDGSENEQGRWEISNMNRVKYVTNIGTENVLWGNRFGRDKDGYPTININGKTWKCHILAFATFHPKLWGAKKPGEEVLHENDDKEDFRHHKLRLGTRSDNAKDARNNGKYDDTKSARIKCASYIDGEHETDHLSLADAVKYLKSNGYPKASDSNISKALSDNYRDKTAYGRTWKKIM